ncbi:prolyl oligopeptidase family protein [Asticcacaulis biprosthecium C19]|uniref:Prolyl oligopeptidase family protein n=2 Tax=Asticcacaulis biprosthecium TaxID=76891 RepID=F4QNK9_9CAUL|nr:prolyl oligopeptidase family protein [Asticcacaulis biprosthecium C19]
MNRRALLGATSSVLALALVPRSAAAQSASTPPPLITFTQPAYVYDIALSPDGKRVAAVTRDGATDNKVLVVFDVGSPDSTRILLGDGKVRGLFWGDLEHVVLLSSSTMDLPIFRNKQEISFAQSINVKTSDVKVFFTNQPDITTSTGSVMAKAGKFYPIAYPPIARIKVDGEYRVTASNVRLADTFDLSLFSFSMGSAIGKLMTQGSNGTDGFVITPDGRVVAKSAFELRSEEWVLAHNTALAEGKQKFNPVYRTKGEVLERPNLIGLGRDGTSVVIAINNPQADGAQYHEISADGALSEALSSPNATGPISPLFHPTTFRLAGFAYHTDTLHYDYFDPGMKKVHEALPKVLGDGYRTYPVSHAEDPRKMIVRSEGNGDAGSYYFVDLTTGDGAHLASDYPELPEEWVTEKQVISYPAADGLTIDAYLTLPPMRSGQNLPLVVLPHGGPQARDYADFDWQAQALASRGYAVLQPNFRGSSGYGQAFVEKGYGEWGRKMQTDLSDGVRHLTGKGIIDPSRVAILGASYGGYAAMAGATLDAGVYRCAVAIAGVSDLEAMIAWEEIDSGSSKSTTVRYWNRFMGDKAGWAEVSPARQASKAYCPILLLHGTDDTVVPIDQSRRMEKALKAAGKPVEFITYKGQDHWETIGSHRIEMMNAAVAFLEKHNPA